MNTLLILPSMIIPAGPSVDDHATADLNVRFDVKLFVPGARPRLHKYAASFKVATRASMRRPLTSEGRNPLDAILLALFARDTASGAAQRIRVSKGLTDWLASSLTPYLCCVYATEQSLNQGIIYSPRII